MYFVFLFALTTFLFRNAFSTYFFNDDFFFLKISRIDNIQQFLNFFSPFKDYFYRPLSTEVFYFLIRLLDENLFLSHMVVFAIYFVGLFFLFKILFLLFKNKMLSYLTVLFYAVNFTHVFQLYSFSTFQEVAAFSFLMISFLNFLKKNHSLSILFFTLALTSKESAILYIVFLFLFCVIMKKFDKKFFYYLFVAIMFLLLYRDGLLSTGQLEQYSFQPNIKLGINNVLWYFFWSLGVPNFTPLYFTSILNPPIPDFWKMLSNFPEIKTYYLLLIIYYLLMIIGISYYLLKNKKEFFKLVNWYLLVGLVGFFIFLGPILFIEHRWMVRLTIPLIFITLIQSILILRLIESGRIFRLIGIVLIGLYLTLQFKGIPIHESSSTFLLESRFTKNAKKYFDIHKKEIVKHKYIYFIDKTKIRPMPWGGSEKLKVTLGDQNFIDHFFPGTDIKAIYGYENKIIPKNSYLMNSFDILLPE